MSIPEGIAYFVTLKKVEAFFSVIKEPPDGTWSSVSNAGWFEKTRKKKKKFNHQNGQKKKKKNTSRLNRPRGRFGEKESSEV